MIPRSMMPDASTVRRLSLPFSLTRRRASVLACLLAAWLSTSGAGAAGGTLDTTFQNPAVLVFSGGSSGIVRALAVQPDSKVVIGGNFTSVGGQERQDVARLNTDGTLDTTFQNPAVSFGNSESNVFALTVQPDGKVVIGGTFNSVGGQTRQFVARLNNDGTLDMTFQNPAVSSQVEALAVQPDGKVVIGGNFTSVGGQERVDVARLNADGTLDTSFLNPAVNGGLEALAVQPDGKVVIGGLFSSVGGQTRQSGARLNTDGTLDTTFQNPVVDFRMFALTVQPDGKVVIVGSFSSVGGQTRENVARLNADGTLDTSFQNPAVNGIVFALALQPNGKMVIGGIFSSVGGQGRQGAARLNTKIIKGRRGLRGRSRTPSTSSNFEDRDRMKIDGGTSRAPLKKIDSLVYRLIDSMTE